MDLFAPRHLIIILLVCLLVFGTKKLRTIGADLGAAIRGFKGAMRDGELDEGAKQITAPSTPSEHNDGAALAGDARSKSTLS